jgi:ABC-type metal ion transport system substrate-binding protein
MGTPSSTGRFWTSRWGSRLSAGGCRPDVEDRDSPSVNLILVRAENQNAKNVRDFVQAYQSDEVYAAALKIFDGGVVKGW